MRRQLAVLICLTLALPAVALEVTETGALPEKGVFVGDVGELSLRVLGSQGLVGSVGARKTQFIQYLNMSEGFAKEAATAGADAELGRTIYQSTIETHEDVPPWETTVTAHEPGQRAAFEATGRLHSEFHEVGQFERVAEGHWRGEVTWTRQPVEGARMRLAVYLFRWLQEQPLTIVRPDGSRVTELDGERLRAWAAGEHGVFEAGTRIIVPLKVGETAIFTLHRQARLTSFNFGVHFGGFWVTPTDAGSEQMRITIERISDPLQVVSGDLTATVEAHSGEAAIHHGPFKLIEHVELVDGEARQREVLPGTEGAWTGETVDDLSVLSGALKTEWTEDIRPADSELGGGALRLAYQGREGRDGPAPAVRLTLPPVHVGQPIEIHGRGPHEDEPVFRTGDGGGGLPLRDGGELRIPLARGHALALRTDVDSWCILERKGTDRAVLKITTSLDQETMRPVREFAVTIDCGPRPADWAHESYTERDFLRMRSAGTGVEDGLAVLHDTPEPGDVQIVSPWWTVTQSAAKGGAIAQIEFAHGREGGVLRGPIGTGTAGNPAESWGNTNCPDALLSVDDATPEHVVVTAEGRLCDRNASPISVNYEITCEYQATHVKRTVRLMPETPIPDVRLLGVAFIQARQSLTEFVGGRTNPIWGKTVSSKAYERRGYPEYVALFERDVEALELFPAEDLTQWSQVTGDPEDSMWGIYGSTIMLGAYHSPDRPITLDKPLEFTHYIGLPPISAANRAKNAWHMLGPSATGEDVRDLAYTGVDSIHGLVSDPIRTGSEENWERATTGSAELIERCHRYGLEIIPYLYFLTMHPDNEVFAEHEAEWQMHNRRRDQACTVSDEWREHYMSELRRLLDEADYDGLYYDFVSIYDCENPEHGPVPHSTVDGLMETLQATREVIGEDAMLIGHRGHQANTVIDNCLDGVVVFEHYNHPHWLPLDELTPLNPFVGASRRDTCTKSLVCSIGGLNPRQRRQEGARLIDADEVLCKLALQGLFPYCFPWSDEVMDRYFHLYACFRSADLSRLTFMDHLHQPAVRSDDPYIRAAAYFNEDEAYVVVANPESDEPRETSFRVDVREFGWDAEECAISEQPDGADARRISADQLRAGIDCSLAGYGYRVYMLRALDTQPRVVSSTHQWEEAERGIVTRGPVGQQCTLLIACPDRPEAITLNDDARDDWTWNGDRGLARINYTCEATDREHLFVLR